MSVALVVGAIGLALVVSIMRLGGGIFGARSRMRADRPVTQFRAAVDASLDAFATLKPVVLARDETGVDVDCRDLQLRFQGSRDACTVYARISLYDRWLPLDRVLGDGIEGARPVVAQAARIGAAAERLPGRILAASAGG